MNHPKETVIERLCALSRADMEAAEIAMPRIRDPKMRARVKEQLERSSAIHEQAERLLQERAPESSVETGVKERLRGRVFRFRTRYSRNPQRVFRLLQRETLQEMKDLGKAVDHFPDSNLKSLALAEEYLMLRQRDLEGLASEFWQQ
jgi:hypothetical protein